MSIQRTFKHIFHNPWSVGRVFPAESMTRIEQAIKSSESLHAGQVVFAIEPSLDLGHLVRNVTPRSRAIEVFSRLRVWDTERNSGVLIYLLLADRDVEIVADRGINDVAGQKAWEEISREMEQCFRNAEFEKGILLGIERITQILKAKFGLTDR